MLLLAALTSLPRLLAEEQPRLPAVARSARQLRGSILSFSDYGDPGLLSNSVYDLPLFPDGQYFDRTDRKNNKYVPFNSQTFSQGKVGRILFSPITERWPLARLGASGASCETRPRRRD